MDGDLQPAQPNEEGARNVAELNAEQHQLQAGQVPNQGRLESNLI